MTVFVDSSALYALLDDRDPNSERVSAELRGLKRARLLTHNYVVLESAALLGARFGLEAVRRLLLDVLPALDVAWIDESIHGAAVAAFLAGGTKRPSLVDFTSFEVMRKLGVRTALAVDRDFADAGFDVIPV